MGGTALSWLQVVGLSMHLDIHRPSGDAASNGGAATVMVSRPAKLALTGYSGGQRFSLTWREGRIGGREREENFTWYGWLTTYMYLPA